MSSRFNQTSLARFAGVTAAAILAHLPALRAGFVLDDDALLVSNPFVRTLSGLRVLVTSELFAASAQPQNVPYYRPLTGALYWASWQMFGASAASQHAFNLVLHAAVAVVMLAALDALGATKKVALFASLLFAVHPATADTVAYIGGRQDLAGWIVMLGTLAFVARATSRSAIAAACFAGTLAAASFREFFACAAIVLAIGAAKGDGKRFAFAAAGGSAGVAAMLVLRWLVGVQAFVAGDAGPFAYVEAAAGVALRLAKDVVAPTDLAVYVSVARVGVVGTASVLAASMAIAVLLDHALVRRAVEARSLSWCGLAAAGATAVMHGAVAVKYGAISDRYAYEAAVAAALVGAAAFEAIRERVEASLATSRIAPLARAFPIVVAVALVPLTWARAAAYRDEATLQTAMIDERPDDPESRLAESFRLFGRGDLEGAYPHCAAYAAARPSSDRANLCVGTWLVVHGRAREAVPLLRVYALARAGDPRARRALLASLFASGDLDGVAGQLAEWEPLFPGASDLVDAREELARRPPPPTPK